MQYTCMRQILIITSNMAIHMRAKCNLIGWYLLIISTGKYIVKYIISINLCENVQYSKRIMSDFARVCAVIYVVYRHEIGHNFHIRPIFVYASSEGSDETARMRSLA